MVSNFAHIMTPSYIIEALQLLPITQIPEGDKIGNATAIARGCMKLPGKRWMWWIVDKLLMILVLAIPAWIIYKILT